MKNREFEEFEKLNKKLFDIDERNLYENKYNGYKVSLLPFILGKALIIAGNIVYGYKPTLAKFRSVEVIARVPYQSWASALYTLLTLFYRDEKRAITFSHDTQFSRLANDNETMHVIVISQIVRDEHKRLNIIIHDIIPMIFALFYFWMSYVLYLINKKWSYELNYMFESHAYEQYDKYIQLHRDQLKEKAIIGEFLKVYDRSCENQLILFESIRNDELIHRNQSIEHINKL